jgi:fatty acid desaturase
VDKDGPQRYTRGEVARHARPNDMWVIVDDKVYDVTTWSRDHPGGKDILFTQAGRDATDIFYNMHHADSIEMLPNFFIGELEDSERHMKRTNPKQAKKDAILRDYRELTDEARRRGYFKSSKLYYSWKVGSHFAMLGVFATMLAYGTPSWMRIFAASVIAGVFYSQNGWLAHDFLHHQVFESRRWNNIVGNMIGGLFQGFSSSWWKNKHNTHHASSNELDNDPDIDQLPIMSFHPVLLRGGKAIRNSPLAKIMIPIQVFTFMPIILLARWNWCIRSIFYALDKDSSMMTPRNTELACIAAHWIIKMTIFAFMPFTKALAFLLLSEAIGGGLIGLMFVLNHNGMHVFTEAEFKDLDFVTLQVLTSRDIQSTWWTDFLSGGLNYQVEHHLFPGMPRHHFHKIAPMVDALCAKNGIPIHRVPFWAGVKEFWASLDASQQCVKTGSYEVPQMHIKHYGN